MPIARSANNVQIIVLVVLSALAVSKALAFDVSSEKIFNVKKYGAVVGEQDDPDGEIADTNHEVIFRFDQFIVFVKILNVTDLDMF